MTGQVSSQGGIDAGLKSQLVFLFTDLTDSTRLSGVMEAETYAQMLDAVREAFRQAVEPRGGSVNQFQGDGLQALFGHPHPREDDGCRAAEAALEIHQRVALLGERFRVDGAGDVSVHSGIHAGLALARPGDGISGRLELFGSAVGIAKHLSDLAEANEVLISEETLGPASDRFVLDQARLVNLKGRAGPMAIRRIVAERASRDAAGAAHRARGLARFVGRSAEIARLDLALAKALEGHTGLAILRAPPGLGKTRLAEEFLARAASGGCQVLRGYCESELSAEPLQPFLQILRASFGIAPDATRESVTQAVRTQLAALSTERHDLRQGLEALLQLMSVAAPLAGTHRAPTRQAVGALLEVMMALAERAPLVLFLDDWQWADMASRQMAHALCAEGEGLLLVLAARPASGGELDPGIGEVIELTPFADPEAHAAIRELLPAADPFVVQNIVRQAGGNPLFLEELCHFAAQEPDASQLEPGGPAWLHTLIASRVAQLPPGQRRVIDAAAVIGTVVPLWLLEGLTGCGAQDPDVRALAAQDLLYPTEDEGLLRFKHGITREVVYAALGLQTRRTDHQRAADLLKADGLPAADQHCEALAYHYQGAGDPAAAAHHALIAGDKAISASSIDRARMQYRAAIHQFDRLAPTADLYKTWLSVVGRLGMAGVFDPSPTDLPIFQRAVVRARAQHDATGLALAGYLRAYCNYALGEVRSAFTDAEHALRAAMDAGEPHLATQIQALQGKIFAAAGDSPRSLRLLDHALTDMLAGQRAGSRPTPALSYGLACRASVLGDLGQLEAARAGFTQALSVLPAAGHEVEGSVRCLRANVLLWHGLWEEAFEDAAAAQRVAERVGSLYLLAMARSLGGWAEWKWRGEIRALERLTQANAWLVGRDKRLFNSINLGRLAEGMAAMGDTAAARHHAAGALWRCHALDPLGAPMALRTLARLSAAAGDEAAALRRLARAQAIATRRDSAHERAANARCRLELALPG